MLIKRLLMIGCVSMISATCAIAQTLKNEYYQPSFTRSYNLEEDALSLNGGPDEKFRNFQRDAGLTVRNEKQTKRSSKKLEKAYEQLARKQKQINRAEDRKIKKNERAYFRDNRKESKKG